MNNKLFYYDQQFAIKTLQNSADKKFNEQLQRSSQLNKLLIEALYKLENFNSIENKNSDEIKILWEKCKDMNLKLKICCKLYTEIQHKRWLLKRLISQNKNCDKVRKRIFWLEDRIVLLVSNDFKLNETEKNEDQLLEYLLLKEEHRQYLIKEKELISNEEFPLSILEEKKELLPKQGTIIMNEISFAENQTVSMTPTDSQFFADQYLTRKHHRYRYNDCAPALLKDNPSSYHFLALPETDSCENEGVLIEEGNLSERNTPELHKDLMDILLNEIKHLCVVVQEKMTESNFTGCINVNNVKGKELTKTSLSLPKTNSNTTWTSSNPSILPMARTDMNTSLPPIYSTSLNIQSWKPIKIVNQNELQRQNLTERSYSGNSFKKDILSDEKNQNSAKQNSNASGSQLETYYMDKDLRIQRINDVIKNNLHSSDQNKKIFGIKILSALKSTCAVIKEELIKMLKHEKDLGLQIECIHGLILSGDFSKIVLKRFLSIFPKSNKSCKIYLLKAIIQAHGDLILDRDNSNFIALGLTLENVLLIKDQELSYITSIALGRLKIQNKVAIYNLEKYLAILRNPASDEDNSKIYQIISSLVTDFNYCNAVIIESIVYLLENVRSWVTRKNVLDILSKIDCKEIEAHSKLSDIVRCLEKILWNDPIVAIREEAGKCLRNLNKFDEVFQNNVKKLYSSDESLQIESLKSIASLKYCNESVKKKMLDMLEFEISESVKYQVMKTFKALRINGKKF